MLTLADEILAELPYMMGVLPLGPIARDVAGSIAADVPSVRRAMEQLEADGRAKIVRRGRALHLVPADYPGLICPVCRAEYVRPRKSRRVTCSRSCGVTLSWRSPEAAQRRIAAITAQRRTPEGQRNTAERNRERWSRPGERERASEQNRARWRDPEMRARLSVSIAKAHGTPERRERQRQAIKARWNDREGRAKLEAGMRRGKQKNKGGAA